MGLGDRHMVIPWKQYQSEVGGAFHPTNFDARKWVGLIKRAGQKYLIVMTDTKDDNWGWVRGATNYRSASVMIHNLIDCTSKGGSFV